MALPPLPLVFRGSSAVAGGLLTRGQLRSTELLRLSRDVYAAPGATLTHGLRCRAFALALPEEAVITGRSAATVRGVPLCWPDDPVQVVAESLPKSRLRVHLVLAGLDPVPQYWIEDADGDRIARVDLAFPEHEVAVEYDGDWRDGESWALNRDRLDRVHALGWTVVFVTAPLLRDVPRMLRTIQSALPP
jgi:hypothetical protein